MKSGITKITEKNRVLVSLQMNPNESKSLLLSTPLKASFYMATEKAETDRVP
jgi:hypothetical protein